MCCDLSMRSMKDQEEFVPHANRYRHNSRHLSSALAEPGTCMRRLLDDLQREFYHIYPILTPLLTAKSRDQAKHWYKLAGCCCKTATLICLVFQVISPYAFDSDINISKPSLKMLCSTSAASNSTLDWPWYVHRQVQVVRLRNPCLNPASNSWLQLKFFWILRRIWVDLPYLSSLESRTERHLHDKNCVLFVLNVCRPAHMFFASWSKVPQSPACRQAILSWSG